MNAFASPGLHADHSTIYKELTMAMLAETLEKMVLSLSTPLLTFSTLT